MEPVSAATRFIEMHTTTARSLLLALVFFLAVMSNVNTLLTAKTLIHIYHNIFLARTNS